MRSKRLPGLPILCITTGNQLGRVRRPIVDPQSKKVVGLSVASSAFGGRKILPIDAVHALGSHAVTVGRTEDLLGPKEERVASLLAQDRIKVVGTPVITARGVLVGTVQDYEIGEGGRIEQLYVSQNIWKALSGGELKVPGEMLIALGKDAAIVADDLLEHAKPAREPEPKRARAKVKEPLEKGSKGDPEETETTAATRVRGLLRQTLTR